MSDYIGTREQVDEYIGSRLVEAAYLGSRKYYDAYSEITGTLPIIFKSRAAVALKNYLLHGTSEGAGVETVNLFDLRARNTSNGYVAGLYLKSDGTTADSTACYITEYIAVAPNTTYTLYRGTTSGSSLSVCEYDANKEYVRGTPYNSRTAVTITTRQDTAYIRASIYYANVGVTTLTLGSTAPSSYIPYGFKIPLTNTGENLISKDTFLDNYTLTQYYQAIAVMEFDVEPNTKYWLKSNYYSQNFATWYITNTIGADVLNGNVNGVRAENTPRSAISDSNGKVYVWGRLVDTGGDPKRVQDMTDSDYIMLVKSDTAPASYIPYRSSTYPLYIGSSKLGAEEYLDYEAGKIYKMVSGVLTPTDPPVSLPAILTYQGENTLSSTETLGECSVTGRINSVTP